VPLETERTAGVASRLRSAQIGKLRRMALETLKQCGAVWATEVAEPMTIDDLISSSPDGVRWLAEAGAAPAPAALEAGQVIVVVGPEGGLTPAEADRLRAAGYRPMSLGPFTLRFETAALAAAAIVAAARQRGIHG
jgi:16S rRNA (uracil1498-N3)-methyltransferase